jgi:hypothetical protein
MAAARMRAPCRLLSYRREILEHLLGEFSADLQQCQAGKRVPQQVSIEATHRCPPECLHCYNNLPSAFSTLSTGGEISARKDLMVYFVDSNFRLRRGVRPGAAQHEVNLRDR